MYKKELFDFILTERGIGIVREARGASLNILDVAAFHTGAGKQVYAVGYAVELIEHHPLYTGLNDEFGAVHAWRGGDIERSAVARIIASGHLGDGVGLGVEHVAFGKPAFVLADVFKSRRSAVESVGDYGAVFDQKRAHLAAHAI